MIRTLIGGLVGGIIIFIMGFIFWASPLGAIPFSHASDPQAAAVQTALRAEPHAERGTGTYLIPDPQTARGRRCSTPRGRSPPSPSTRAAIRPRT